MQRRNLISKLCSNIYLVLVFLFLYAPILALVIFSFNDSKSMGVLNGFTMKWYVALFRNLPVLNTDIVTGVALMSLFAFFQMNFGFKTMLLSHVMFCTPYVILSVLPKLRQLPDNVEEAALDLGATPWLAIRKIVIPQIKPGIMSGFLMAFTMSIDDFIISFFNTGNGVSNLSIEIYGMARRGIKPEINALSSLMFLTVLVLLILANRKDSIIKNSALGKA